MGGAGSLQQRRKRDLTENRQDANGLILRLAKKSYSTLPGSLKRFSEQSGGLCPLRPSLLFLLPV